MKTPSAVGAADVLNESDLYEHGENVTVHFRDCIGPLRHQSLAPLLNVYSWEHSWADQH